MSTIRAYNPTTLGFDFAHEFFAPTKKTLDVYEPFSADYGSMLTVTFRNGAQFGSQKSEKFDFVSYFVNFFLATLFLGHESELKFKLGLEKSYWYFDAQRSQLKIFTTTNLNGRKKLILKTINLKPELVSKKHEWDKLDLKSLAFAMNGENLASYSVESHWYDIWAENLEPTTLVSQESTVPFFLFTLEVKDDVKMNMKMTDSSSKRTRKNFHKVDTNDKEIPEFKNILKMLASEDEIVATRGFDEMLRKLELFYRKNFYGGTVEEIRAFSSVSQCGFTHGAFTSIQKKLNLKIAVDQTKITNPAFRIRIGWNVKQSWKDVATKWPMQVDFIANLDQLEQNRRKVLGEALAASAQMSIEMMAYSFRSDVLLAHVNFHSREKSHMIAKIPVVSPLTATISLARRLGAITLDVPLREHLERLKLFLDGELSFLLQAFRPAVKSEKSKFASRYVHGCIASSDFLSEPNTAAYKIELKNPSKLEKQSMTSFLINTIDECVDLILNVYEMHKFHQRDFTEITAYSGSRKYPKTSDKVKHTVIYDFYVSFTETGKKEFRSLLSPKSQCYMKSIAKVEGSDFHMRKIEPLHLLQEFRNYDGKAPDQAKNDKKILMQIKEYFNENFLYLQNKYEIKALLHGLLHKVKIVPNIIDVRKNVLQVAFMDHNDQKMNLVNFAYGTNNDVIESLDDMREFVDSNLLKDTDNVKTMNLAIVHQPDSESKTLAVRNDFLSVLGLCQKFSKNRAKRQNKCFGLEELLPNNKEKNKAQVNIDENDLKLHETKTNVYLKNLGRISSGIMFGLMAKDFISDLIHGNVAGMAVNAGFIISNILANHFADRLWSKIKLLTKEDKILLAGILKVGSPFLRRLPSFAFVGFDLYNNIQAYKNNQSEALVGIVADTGYIALDVAETAIEVAEGFGVIEGVSAVTGPIGWATGAALLVGADIYRSANKVQHINANIHLTKMERFTEGLRSFFGMDPEDHIQKLMEEKRELREVVTEMRIFLKQSPTIKRYVFPMNSKDVFPVVLVNLQNTTKSTISRALPQMPSSDKYFCLPTIDDNSPQNIIVSSYICKNALGLEDSNSNKTTNVTYIQIANHAIIYGSNDGPNFYDVLTRSTVEIHGGSKDDTLILRNNSISGLFIGNGGQNIIDISNLIFIGQVSFTGDHVFWNRKFSLAHYGVTGVIGRKNFTDRVTAWCSLSHVELFGGIEPDYIDIPEKDCFYNLSVIISRGNTWLKNNATNGIFMYAISDIEEPFHLQPSSNTNQTVFLNYDCLDLERINIEILDEKAMVSFHFPRNTIGVIEMDIRHPIPVTFVDGSLLQLKNNHASIDINTSLTVEEAIRIYSKFVAKSSISCIVHSAVQNTTVTLNHHSLVGNTSDYVVDIAFSASTHQSFKSMADEIVYVINAHKAVDQNNFSAIVAKNTEIQVDYEHKQKIVVDLDQLVSVSSTKNIDLRPYVSGWDIKINVSVSNQNPINQITFKNAMKNQAFENIVLRKHSPFVIEMIANDSLILSSVPLVFEKEKNLIVLDRQDRLDFGLEVHFARKLYDYDLFNMNETDLMMTNILNTVINEDAVEDHFTVILKDFFVDEIMKSLKLVFKDKKISFSDDLVIVKPVSYLFTSLSVNAML